MSQGLRSPRTVLKAGLLLTAILLGTGLYLGPKLKAVTPNPTLPTGGIGFGPATIIDSQRTEGEPLNHIDRYGNIWETGPWGFSTAQGFVAKSTDNGDSFHIVSPVGLRPNLALAGGGDTDIATDDQGNAYFADLEGLAAISVAVSNDGGNSWRANPLASGQPGDDRQWLSVDNGPTPSTNDNTVFLVFNQLAFGWTLLSSRGSTGSSDMIGGLQYDIATGTTGVVTTDDRCGRLLFDPNTRNLYLPCTNSGGNHVEIWKASVGVGIRTGLVFTAVEAPPSPGGLIGLGHLFSDVAVDMAGNLYAVWIDINNNNVYLSSSVDQGSNWTSPVQVNGDPANSNVMPWAVGGAAGIVDIAFYGTDSHGNSNSFPNWQVDRVGATAFKWFVYFVQVRGATNNIPTIYQVKASEHPTDYGQICTGGLGCTGMGDRTLADFFTLAIDSRGAARIVIDDLTNQHHGAALFELTQNAGPSAIGTTLTPQFPNVSAGVTDPAGDAQVPHYSLVPGQNQPALDLLAIRLSQPDSSHLTVTLKLNSLAQLVPPPGATGLMWLTRWQFKSVGEGSEESYRIFYLGANFTLGQSIFFSGTGKSATPGTGVPPGNGCITTSPQNCKIILYPSEKIESGILDIEANTITITAPLSHLGSPLVGDRLYSVTALTYGFNKGDPLLLDADASRAFDFIVGQTSPPGACQEADGNGNFQGQQQGNFQFDDDGCLDGDQDNVQSTNRGDGRDFHSTQITSVSIDNVAHTITIAGVGVSGGVAVTFVFTALETSQLTPGWVSFTFSDGYTNAGTLTSGNILLH